VQQPRKAAESAEDVVVVRLLRIIAAILLALRGSSRIEVNSCRIKPNQTCLLVCPPPPYVGGYARRCCGCVTFVPYHVYSRSLARTKPDQGESCRIKPNQTCRDGAVAGQTKSNPVKPVKPSQTTRTTTLAKKPLMIGAPCDLPLFIWTRGYCGCKLT
jgi:hypothetical protein